MTALDHVRVIELANERISFAGKLLADMGADVILVEPPSGDASRSFPPFVDDEPGDHRSLHFLHYNTSKRSVILDLDDESGRDSFRRLIASSDILLESEPTQRLRNLGADYAQLCKFRRRLNNF